MGARTRGFANNVLTSGKLDATDGLTGNLASTNFANATVTNIEELPPAVGSAISSVAGNPAAPVAEGKIWYNTSTDSFNIAPVLEAWSSEAPTINLAGMGGGAGTTTAGLTFGGRNPPGPNFVSTTEEYNGSGWSSGGSLSTARSYVAGFGTQTDAVCAGGRIDAPGTSTNATEEYDGSSWTAGGNLGTGRKVGGSAGTTGTAGLAIAGPGTSATEEYDGTAWTAGGSLNTGRFYLGGFGTQTSAVAAGGNGGDSATEEYDGSTWTTVNSLNNARTQMGSSGSSQTAGLVFGGEGPPYPTQKANTESYDGTTWTETADLATARRELSGSGGNSGTSAFAVGGFPTYNLTEEFNKSVNVITAGAWASGGAYPISTFSAKFVGDKDAGLGFAGYNAITTTCEYNGSSWTNVPSLPAGGGFGLGYAGTQTAGLAWHGYSGTFGAGGFNPATAYEYNGSSWTSGGATPFQGRDSAGFGIQTAAIGAGGYTQTPAQPPTGVGVRTANTISYDGSTWTNVNSMNTARELVGGFGVQTAGVVFGGQAPPANNLTEDWNGTNWTASNTMNIGRRNVGGFGTQTEGYAVGGRAPNYPSPNSNFVEEYNGSSWVTSSNLATGRSSIAVASNLAGPGQSGSSPYAPLTEEFTGETSALNVESLTTS